MFVEAILQGGATAKGLLAAKNPNFFRIFGRRRNVLAPGNSKFFRIFRLSIWEGGVS
jgi:hypothetical protein